MFKPTAPLQRRVESRLRGYRTKSIRILRKAIASLDNNRDKTAIILSSNRKHHHSHSNYNLIPPSYSIRHGFVPRVKRTRPRSQPQRIAITKAQDALNHIPIDSQLSRQSTVPLSNYFSPEDGTSPPWRHSIYKFNKSTLPLLPILTDQATKAISTYLNGTPQGQSQTPSTILHLTLNRAFVSDQRASVKQDLLGKLSFQKNGFLLPFRRLLERQPRVRFNHYADGGIGIGCFVYDRRVEILRQRVRRLESMLRSMAGEVREGDMVRG